MSHFHDWQVVTLDDAWICVSCEARFTREAYRSLALQMPFEQISGSEATIFYLWWQQQRFVWAMRPEGE
jgi:hypothetical protein